ncbi:DUF1648 domain-containing protein [Bifidobacterium vansinderenii]|uniref:LacI family transcriptional regulator n=1 Tax=Bifidobacterium vansinderenii TaxID=1984871 RepID=A0A229VXZ2_9BIFI|nr:DUF5808 domain-containing protein [Bifidobacterium vansinderenii]OXN00491.1 LacI family transcriptional regulator [Bifidobacterium vansinderenii]
MNTTTSVTIMTLITFLLAALVAIAMAAMPWVADRRECFGVSVPSSAHTDDQVRGLKRAYAAAVSMAAVIMIVIAALMWWRRGAVSAMVIMTVAMLLQLPVGFAAQQICRRHMLTLKHEHGWKTDSSRRTVLVGERMPRPLGLTWELLHVPALAVTLVVGNLGYSDMPQRVPMHMNAAGEIDSWVDKSPILIWYAVGLQLMLAVLMTVSHLVLLHAKKPINPNRPVSSAYAYGVFLKVWSVYLIVAGPLVAMGIGLGLQLSMIGVVGLDMIGLIMMVVAVAALAAAVMIGLIYGQNGSRVYAASRADDDRDAASDDDRHWKAGVFYWNPDDPAVMVPKRFGVGWTCNFARPLTWVIMLALMALCLGSIAFAVMI